MSAEFDLIPNALEVFAPIIAKHNLKIVQVEEERNFERVILANDTRVLTIALDVQDGYVYVRYGRKEALSWIRGEAALDHTLLSGLEMLMHQDGVEVPSGTQELYFEKRFREALELLAEGALNHEAYVFGAPDWE
ncbi:MAG: hypothetical protein ACAH95_10730 [Fimbriimonas sp.]